MQSTKIHQFHEKNKARTPLIFKIRSQIKAMNLTNKNQQKI